MPKASKNRTSETLQRLETELDRLKSKFQMGQELKLLWMPNDDSKSGEVTGDQSKASDTLRHEFIEYLLTRDLVAPYKRCTSSGVRVRDWRVTYTVRKTSWLAC